MVSKEKGCGSKQVPKMEPRNGNTGLNPLFNFDPHKNHMALLQNTHLNSRWRILIFRVQLMSVEYN